MAYIGRDTDKISNVEVLDNITFDGSSSYTLQKNSVNFTPSSANTLLVSIDGVVQAGNFTVSGSTIDFGTAVAGTSTCDFVLHYGVGLITAPSDGTVTTAKLADSSVSLAKLTATGTKDATTFLRGDNTFATAGLTGVTTDSGNVTITDGDLIFGGAGHGVYLGVTSATAANHLDDYEEGSFTPAYGFDSGSVTMQSGSRGDYVKIGNLVHFQIYMATTAISSPSGDTSITGLPFTTGDNSSSTATIGLMYRFGTDFDGDTKARISQDGTTIQLFKNASSSTSATRIQGSDFTSGSAYNNLHIAGCYSTA